ncbi:MAG: DUF4405 domain-containing protein [bacterium]|nr:DUF4405 domain-containing protein [bacterium]
MSNKTSRFYLLDVFLFVSMFVLMCTGAVMAFFTSSGPGVKESSKYFLELHRHQWGNLHSYFAALFALLFIFHLAFRWTWIKGKTDKLFGNSKVVLLIIPLSLGILVLSWYFIPANTAEYDGYGMGAGQGRKAGLNKQAKLTVPESTGAETTRSNNEFNLETGANPDHESHVGKGDQEINGRMTLGMLEEKTGLPAASIAKKLGLPDNVSHSEKLGRLRKNHGFTMQDVRDAVK